MHETTHSMLAHQFDDLAQQREADTLGMWAFLATEVLFFGAVFMSFALYRIYYTDGFVEGAHKLSLVLGGINTAILLTSSYTVVLSVHAAEHGDQKSLVRMLIATIVLGVVFLGIKATEYAIEYQHGLIPGLYWHPHEALRHPDQVKLFLSFYFIMTAIHALHMIVGIGIFGVITYKAMKGHYSPEYYNPVEIGGLYWHFVDLVWIFLFPVLYLLR